MSYFGTLIRLGWLSYLGLISKVGFSKFIRLPCRYYFLSKKCLISILELLHDTSQNFFVKIHIFLGHDALDFGKNNMFLAKIISEKNVFCLNFIFSKYDAPGQK